MSGEGGARIQLVEWRPLVKKQLAWVRDRRVAVRP